MKFILLIYGDEKAEARRAEGETARIVASHQKVAQDLRAAGKMVAAERLRREAEAVRVRVKGDHRQVVDGPFAETKEALGGFYLIECGSKQEALDWAARLPSGDHSFVEVRPVWEM